ncbi:MAG: TadE family protein [Pseudomonadota bacterium]
MKRAALLLKAVRRQRGAATTEFYIVAFFAFIPLVLAILQMGMYMVAKNTVNTAALGVARAGAASGGDKKAMQVAFANGVMPLYAATGLSTMSGNGDKEVTTASYPQVYAAAIARAKLETALPLLNKITVLNPSSQSFQDFGINKPGVGRIIPHTNMDFDKGVVRSASRQTRADALLLKVEVQYCYEMMFPIIDVLVTEVFLNPLISPLPTAAELLCYLPKPITGRRGIMIRSQAVVRMTTAPVQGRFP